MRVAGVSWDKLVAKGEYSSETERKGKVHCLKPLPSNGY
jgi:hypothetical protein